MPQNCHKGKEKKILIHAEYFYKAANLTRISNQNKPHAVVQACKYFLLKTCMVTTAGKLCPDNKGQIHNLKNYYTWYNSPAVVYFLCYLSQ